MFFEAEETSGHRGPYALIVSQQLLAPLLPSPFTARELSNGSQTDKGAGTEQHTAHDCTRPLLHRKNLLVPSPCIRATSPKRVLNEIQLCHSPRISST
jgi:hypothetical protein